MSRSLLASLLAIGSILLWAPTALAADTAAAQEDPTASVETAQVAEPSQAQVAEPSQAQVAEPSQTPDDVSGGNEYTEDGVPTGTGDDDSSPPEEPTSGGSEPTQDTTESSAGESVVGQDAGDQTATAAPAADTLPRTGSDSWLLALVGVGLLGLGAVLRRVGEAAPSG
jgi:LPXTG-motif cell wall-anchored protein